MTSNTSLPSPWPSYRAPLQPKKGKPNATDTPNQPAPTCRVHQPKPRNSTTAEFKFAHTVPISTHSTTFIDQNRGFLLPWEVYTMHPDSQAWQNTLVLASGDTKYRSIGYRDREDMCYPTAQLRTNYPRFTSSAHSITSIDQNRGILSP